MWRARSWVCTVISSLAVASAANAAQTQLAAPPIILVCHMKSFADGSSLDNNFTIDETAQTVNSKSASISNGAIYLKELIKSTEYITVINRYTGLITINTDKFPVLEGQCQLARERRF